MKLPKIKNKILFLLIIVLIILSLSFFQKEVKSFFYFVSSPIQKVFWKTGDSVSGFFQTIFTVKNLKKENEELSLKNQELLSENSQLKEFKKENDILREALNLGLQKEFKLEIAEVISRDFFQDFILINMGGKSGLKKGMPVLTSGKVVLGKISEVYDNFSKVMLISDKLSSFDAKIPASPAGGQDSDTYGVVKGEGNYLVIFDLIPQDKEIKQGDLVVTSSLGGIFPKGFLVGTIKEVKKSDVTPYQKADLQPLFSPSNLETVFVITSF